MMRMTVIASLGIMSLWSGICEAQDPPKAGAVVEVHEGVLPESATNITVERVRSDGQVYVNFDAYDWESRRSYSDVAKLQPEEIEKYATSDKKAMFKRRFKVEVDQDALPRNWGWDRNFVITDYMSDGTYRVVYRSKIDADRSEGRVVYLSEDDIIKKVDRKLSEEQLAKEVRYCFSG